jgi:hypothetical protein
MKKTWSAPKCEGIVVNTGSVASHMEITRGDMVYS